MEENRRTLIVPEKKEKIQKIKEKYKNLSMSDETAEKIQRLEVVNKVLKGASDLAGVAFFIDLIVPDPVIGIDEALLGGITAATKTANSIINNKIEDLAKNGSAEMQMSEVKNLAGKINNIVAEVRSKKGRTI